MQFETTVEIEAAPDKVWATLADVERWPEWTASMTHVERLNGEPLALGAMVRVKQPRMPTLVWKVTELDPGQSFSWQSDSTGVTTVASHVVKTTTNNRVTVTLGIRQSGTLAPVIGLLTSKTTRRYIKMEAEGLKQRCEAERRDAQAGSDVSREAVNPPASDVDTGTPSLG